MVAPKKALVTGLLAFFLIICVVVSVSSGVYSVSLSDVCGVLSAHLLPFSTGDASKLNDTIVWEIRMPRIMMALLAGAALATAGAAYQGCLRNPLVDPYILGVSAGAAFGAALAIVRHVTGFSVHALAFFFAALAVCITCFLSRTGKQYSALTLILAGVIVDSIFFALVSILQYMSKDTQLREIVFWLMGGFYYASWADVKLLLPVVALCLLLIWLLGWKINVLSMGDEEARSMGVDPDRYRIIVITAATLATAVSVSMVGIIPWVGLMIPHAARMLLGPDHRYTLLASAFMGGAYLILCDTLARTLTSSEIPVGIIASIIGAPYLIYLLRANSRFLGG